MKLVQSINYKLYAETDILINTRQHSIFFVSSPCDEQENGRVRCPNLDFIQLESFLWRLAFISHVTQQKNTIVLPINPSYHDQTLLELEVLETKHWPVTMLNVDLPYCSQASGWVPAVAVPASPGLSQLTSQSWRAGAATTSQEVRRSPLNTGL